MTMFTSKSPTHEVFGKEDIPMLKENKYADLKLEPRILTAIAIVTIVFQIALLPYFGYTGLGVFGLAVAFAWLIVYGKQIIHTVPLILLITVVTVSTGLIWRANEFLQGLFTFALLFSQSLLFVNFVWTRKDHGIFQSLQLLYKGLFKILRQLECVISTGQAKGKQGFVASWLKTITIVLAVLVFFSILLYQADPVFAQTLRDINILSLVNRLIWALIISVLVTSIFTSPKESDDSKDIQLGIVSERDLTVSMTALLVLFGSFLIIQWQYLFAGTRDLLIELDMTLSEYVRKGFLELLSVVFFGLILVYINALKIRESGIAKYKPVLTVVTLIGVVELFLLLGSALKRDLMYVDAYGLTRMRIVGEVFLVWLACMLLLLGSFVLFKKMKDHTVFVGMLFASFGASLFFTVFNMDNYLWAQAPSHHNYTDYYYLSNLSADTGERMFSESLPRMKEEIQVLSSKNSLSAVERSQMAGIKLALLSLREQRNRAYLQSATSQQVWSRHKQLGYDFYRNYNLFHNSNSTWKHSFINSYESSARVSWAESVNAMAYETQEATQTAVLPKFLTKRRGWQQISVSGEIFNRYVLSHPELFSTIDELIMQIRKYQYDKNIDLSKEERTLIYELEYPLVKIKFKENESLQQIHSDFSYRNIQKSYN